MTSETSHDCVSVEICRYDDNSFVVNVRLQELDGLIVDRLERQYRPSTDASDVIEDVCRVLCGWGALGALGFGRVVEDLRHSDAY